MPKTERRLVLLTTLVLAGLVLPPLAPSAAAQAQADLHVVHVTAGSPRYLVPATVTVTIENRGGVAMTGNWQLFLGWNGLEDRDCINAHEGVSDQVNTNKPCYYRHGPADGAIGAGERKVITVAWTPGGPQRGTGRIHAQIGPWGIQTEGQEDNPTPLPTENPAGNVASFSVTVHSPVVTAVPDRVPVTDGGNPNAPWRWEQVTRECETPQNLTTWGCRATPGREVRFAFNVTNAGTIADSYTGYVQFTNAQKEADLAAKGYRFNLSPQPVAVPRGATERVYLTVYVPETELRNHGVNLNVSDQDALRLRWYSSVNTDVHTSATRHCEGCTDPTLPTLYAGVRRGMNATTNETFKAIRPAESATFNVRVENTGNDEDTYNVTLVPGTAGFNDSWQPRITEPPRLRAGEAANATIDLVPPEDAPKGLYPFTLLVRSNGDPTIQKRIPFTADLLQKWGLASSLLPSSTQVAPGEKATYALTLTNLGNGMDNATLTLGGQPGGWDVGLSETRVRLAPFGSARVLLNVTAPPGTAAGTEARIKIDATSEGSNNPLGFPKEKAPEANALLTVLSRPNVDVTLEGASKKFVDAGASTDWTLVVRNTGNLASTFNVELKNPDTSWVATATPQTLTLNPLQQGSVSVSLRAPGDSLVGETLRVTAVVASASVPDRYDEETLVGAVSGSDLSVKSMVANTTTPYTGDPLALDIVVANEGNKAPPRNATLRVLLIQGGVERVIDEIDYPASELPGGRRFSARALWDTTGVEGPGVLVARIDPADAIREIDDSAASNEASLAIVLRTFDVSLTAPEGLSGRPGEKVTYGERPHVFLLRHRGNQPTEPVRVHVESEHGWIDPEKAQISLELPRGAEVPVPVELIVPQVPGAATDALRVTVVPTLRPNSVVSASVTTRVLDEEKPRVLDVDVTPAKARIGENVTIEALVRDATGVREVKARLVSPANDTSTLPMAHVGGDRWALRQSFTVAGDWRVFVEASDNAEPANVNVTLDDLVPFTIDPGSAPAIRLAEGQGTTIRSGTPVKLNVTDPLGVARAAYVIRGITYDMPRPFQIDTSAFPAGNVEVLVEAENVYGVKAQQRFNLTVDNTPPEVRKVTLDPEAPRANQDAILRIETDPNVESVEVLLRKDGRVLETRAATKKGPGLFELLLNPGEGDYVLDVTAKDAAGNVKLEEGAVQFSAKPKSPFEVPAPGIALLALALAGAALLAARRRAR